MHGAGSPPAHRCQPAPPALPTSNPLAQNELGILEMIHCMVETLDKWFSNVCELDIMFSLDTTHHIIDEMVANGTQPRGGGGGGGWRG